MNHKKLTRKIRSKRCTGCRKARRPFPYLKVARLWDKNKTIAEIARATGRVDKRNPKDPYHSLRNFLRVMHIGYMDATGRMVRLPYRVSPGTVRASRKAGMKAA
jgi:hypothetical protein